MAKSPITCHVLDASIGQPAADVHVTLECVSLSTPSTATTSTLPSVLATGMTNPDGRCSDLLDPGVRVAPGTYKIVFQTGEYYAAKGTDCFHPLVEIMFKYTDPEQHYHIPLLLSPYSYTTYRGS